MATTLTGWVTRGEFFALLQGQMADPRTARVTRHLIECRELTGHGLTADDLPRFGEMLYQDEVVRRGNSPMRTAVVVDNALDADRIQMLNGLVLAVRNASFFFSTGQAYRWLGLEPAGPAPRPPRAADEGRG